MNLLSHQPGRITVPTGPGLLTELLRALTDAGLRGRGGAAFPTATKLDSARGRRPVLIVNACDGEPLVDKDAVLLATSPGLVADGIALVAAALDCREVVIATHTGSRSLALAEQLLMHEASRLPRSRVLAVPHRYVSSEASALVASSRGGTARPIFHDGPLSRGSSGPAALVLNAETVAQVAVVWSGRPSSTRLLTLAGSVERPGVVETDDDVPLHDLVERAARPIGAPQALLVGGYGGTWLPWPAAGHSIRSLAGQGVGIGAGLVYVLGESCPHEAVAGIADYLAAESAGQCGPCMFGLPALAADWRALGDPGTAAAARDRLARRLPVVEGRGGCRHPDGAVGMLVSAVSTFDEHLQDHQRGVCRPRRVAAPDRLAGAR